MGTCRPGRDRWHHPDGTILNRARERDLRAAQSRDEDNAGKDRCAPAPEADQEPHKEEKAAKSFYEQQFAGSWWEVEDENSTTAGEADTESSACCDEEHETGSSSDSTPGKTGFFRYGVWQDRPRTPYEQKQHLGGCGPQRTQRRQDRMTKYFEGKWKPAWLVSYIKQRDERRKAMVLPEVREAR